MQTTCVHCGARYRLTEEQVVQRSRVQFRCSKCNGTTEIDVKASPDLTTSISPLPSFARSSGTTSEFGLEDESLKLPSNLCLTLTIAKGPAEGTVFQLSKPRVIIGRKDADLLLADPGVSQRHAAVEVRDRMISLKDLNSTNGTFFEEERVRAAVLLDGAEFRVGSTVLRLSAKPS
jgi:predicted Zn finger-like uncharacterized protein